MGSTFRKKLSKEEYATLKRERDQQLENGEIDEPSRRTCSDKGTKCTHRGTSVDNPCSRKKYKSVAIVRDEEEEGEDNPVAGPSAENGGTSSEANPAVGTTGMANVNESAENGGTIQGGMSTNHPVAGATSLATASMANVSALTKNGSTIHRETGINASPGVGAMTHTTINNPETSGTTSFRQSLTDLIEEMENALDIFDGVSTSLF